MDWRAVSGTLTGRPIAVVRQEQSRREAMSLVVESPPLPADSRSSAPSSRGWRVWTAATVLCWLVPVATHLLGIDAVLPVVIWLGTASLLRSGRSLLDRVMLAAALLAGLVGPAGLLFSVWPWGLHPVPVAGVALTGLVVVSAVTGRRPQLPWAGGVADVVTVAAALGVTGLVAWPLLHMSATGRLARFMLGEDIVRHFTVFDTIRRVGGYLYFHQDVAATTVQHGIATYPQGSHIATALLDNFVRSSTAAGSSLQAFEHYLWFYVAAFGFLVLSVLWAIRWVAGPSAAGWSFVPLAALGAGYLFLADGLPVFLFGFVSQIAAMALLASLIAVLVRPLRDLREQVLLVTALVVALSMTYYLFLLSAGVVVVIWVIRYRHRLAPARRWLAMALLVGAPLTVFAPLVNLDQAYSVRQLTDTGSINPVNRHLLPLLLLPIAGGLATRFGRRSPAWRMVTVWLVVTAGSAAALWAYQHATVGNTSYYFEKALQQLLLVGLVASGAIPLLIRRPGIRPRRPFSGSWPATLDRAAPATVVTMAIVLALGFYGGVVSPAWYRPATGLSWGRAYLRGPSTDMPSSARSVMAAVQRPPGPDGTIEVLLMYQRRQVVLTPYYGTLFLSAFRRNSGIAYPAAIWTLPTGSEKTEQDIRRLLDKYSVPVRIYTDSVGVIEAVNSLKNDDPAARIDVVFLDPDAPRT